MNCQNKAQDMMMKIEVIILEIWPRFYSSTIFYLSFHLIILSKLGRWTLLFFERKKREINLKRVMTFVLAVYEKKIKLF